MFDTKYYFAGGHFACVRGHVQFVRNCASDDPAQAWGIYYKGSPVNVLVGVLKRGCHSMASTLVSMFNAQGVGIKGAMATLREHYTDALVDDDAARLLAMPWAENWRSEEAPCFASPTGAHWCRADFEALVREYMDSMCMAFDGVTIEELALTLFLACSQLKRNPPDMCYGYLSAYGTKAA